MRVACANLFCLVGRHILTACGMQRGGASASSFSGPLALEVATFLIIPGGLVVTFLFGVEAGIEPVVGKLESFFNNESSVGVVDEIILSDAIVGDGVIDQPTQKSNVRPGANLYVHIRVRSRTRQPRIDNNSFRITVN